MDTTRNKTHRTRASLPEDISLVYTEETELHWQRIITACLVVVALLTTMGWILMNSISAQEAAQVISAEPATEASPKASLNDSNIAVETKQLGQVQNGEASAEAPAAAEVEPQLQQLEEAIPEVPSFEDTLPQLPQDKPQTVAPTFVGQLLPLYAHMPDMPEMPVAPLLAAEEFLQVPEKEDLVQVTKNPFYVEELQLTSDLEDKSPTDVLGGEITLGDRNLIKVYAYSELTNLKGEQVYHEWYRGNKRMARIPVGVYLDDMRASTSKYIDQTMGGDWHLRITRSNGEQLGRMDFRVKADT